jgi:ubiquitin carboxyl-terminal hydrolase 34
MNEKINSRVEFPIELELKNYLAVDRPDALYRLVGVVVHFGAAEFGHYFSYIDIERDREAFLKTVTG